ncbi:hypothetical protein BVY02_00170 [bacterium J17]|nr:hypothetical protein BVY02_00170 [bacterium J17]
MPETTEIITEDASPKRLSTKFLIRLAVSGLFLWLVYRSVDSKNLLFTLRAISLQGILLIALLYTFGQVISAIKWRIFVQEVGIYRGISQTLKAYFLGMFVNTFGLGTVGGDLARSIALKPSKGERGGALATVVADRVHGLAVLLTIGALGIITVQPAVLGPYAVILACAAVVSLAFAWVWGPKLLVKIFPLEHKHGRSAVLAAEAFPRKIKPFLKATLISVFFHFIQISMNYVIARELGAPLSLAYLIATVPLVNAASSLPLSINGLGIRDAMYLFLFMPVGVSREAAVSFGVIWIVTVTLVSAVGGLALLPDWLRGKNSGSDSQSIPKGSEVQIKDQQALG